MLNLIPLQSQTQSANTTATPVYQYTHLKKIPSPHTNTPKKANTISQPRLHCLSFSIEHTGF